jgi:hypothetical protein
MERIRLIAAAPVRSASEAWSVIVTLLADTLERSSSVPSGSVSKELALLKGLGPALIAAGHLESKGLVLVDTDLRLTIRVLTADAALDVEENLKPVPGGANATDRWTLYLPSAGPLNSSVEAAVKNSTHLTTDAPLAPAPAEKSVDAGRSLIDVNALRNLGIKP